MKEVVLDFGVCANWLEVHELLQSQLGFPYFYGMNLDALWDCLTGFIETPVTIAVDCRRVRGDVLFMVNRVVGVMEEAAGVDPGIVVRFV